MAGGSRGFHDSREGCHDRTGYYLGGVVDPYSPQVSYLARRTILHELAHGWLEASLSQQRAEFRVRPCPTTRGRSPPPTGC